MISRKGLHDAARAADNTQKVHTFKVPGQVPVTISRPLTGSYYAVKYGKQQWLGQYEKACTELGRLLMHAIGCNGFHDGNPDYDISEEDHTRER